MNTSKILNGVLLGSAFTFLAAVPAQAMVIRQTQEMSSSTNVKVEGGSDVKAEASSDSWGRQSQRIVTDDTPSYHMGNGGRYRGNYSRPVWVRPATNGQVRLSWDMRGGTCHVRYTESTSRGYNYETSANCDDGGITIGGLVSGKNYRFQVRQDDGAWSAPRTVRAW